MKEENKHTLDIKCPHCNEKNTLKFSKDLKCKKCDNTIMGATTIFKTNKTTLFLTALTSITVGSVLADKHIVPSEVIALVSSSALTLFYTYRLKIETEYKIMKTCIDRFGTNTIVRDTCFCAVKKLSTYLNSQIAKIKGEEWLSNQLDSQYNQCGNVQSITNQTND